VRFPGETLFVNLDRENHRFRRKFGRVKGTKTRLSSLAITITKTTLKKAFEFRRFFSEFGSLLCFLTASSGHRTLMSLILFLLYHC
jgi:hypothetical protein